MSDTYGSYNTDDLASSDTGVSQATEPTDVGTQTFTQLRTLVKEGAAQRSWWTKEAKRAYDFVANHQWSQEDMDMLAEQNRPSVTFNRTAPIIEAVCGLEVNNRRSVVYLPRTTDDTGVNESYTAAGKWMRDECNAEDEESQAFKDLAICGEGWTESYMDFDDKPTGMFAECRLDPVEMGTNASANKANYSDARLIYRAREMQAQDAEDLFDGQYNASAIHAGWWTQSEVPADGGNYPKIDYPSETRQGVKDALGSYSRKCMVVQIQWWERVPMYLVAEEGQKDLHHLTREQFDTYSSRVTQMQQMDAANQQAHGAALQAHMTGLQAGTVDPTAPLPQPPQPTAPSFTHAQVKRKQYYEAYLGGSAIIDAHPIPMNEFTFKAMTGKRDRTKKCFYGLVRDMFDPQMWSNKWMSQTMHILNTNAKGGIMAETDAFVNVKNAERDWSDNSKIIWVKPGSLQKQKVKERIPPPLPQGLGELMQFAVSSIRDVSGVNLEFLGQADREQASSLELQRRQSAMTILATLFDSLRRFRKLQGRLTLHFIQMLPAGTLTRVLDQGQYKYIPLMKEKDTENFDVIIDEGPSSPDQKQATWALTIELIRSGIPLPPPVLMTLLKYSPYPESVVKEISDAAGMGNEMPPAVLQQKLQQAEQALQTMEKSLQAALQAAEMAKDERGIKVAKTQIDEYNAVTNRIAAESKAATEQYSAEAETNIRAMEATMQTPSGEAAAEGQPQAAPAAQVASSQNLQQQINQLEGLIQQMLAGVGQQTESIQPQTPTLAFQHGIDQLDEGNH